ncbi:uncharacterized protein LOC109839647 [Asparagus officinalis]|nr:uncharacterized protein LOC109839647 [Asparagus officinalis]
MRELYTRDRAKSGLTKEGNAVCLEEVNGKFVEASGTRCGGFNLELPADVYVEDSAKNPVKEKGGCMVPLSDKGKNLYCYEVIDLEEPTEMESQIEPPTGNCGLVDGSTLHIASDMASSSQVQNGSGFVPSSSRKQSDFVPDLNLLLDGCSERWGERKDDHSGAGGSESSVPGLVNTSTNSTHKQEPNSSKPILIDLNIPQDDESSHSLNDPTLTYSSPSSTSSIVQKSTNWLFPLCQDSQRSNISDFDQIQASNSTGITECCRKSAEGFSSDSNGELPNDAGRTALSSEDVNVPQDGRNEKSLSGIKSNDLNESTECSSKIVEEVSGTTQLDNMAVESSLEKTFYNEHQHDQDRAVVNAAEILSGICLASSSASPIKQYDTTENKKDEPQYSTDTFETMTLELPEVISNDHLTQMIEVEENAGDNATRVHKLKRGRGRIRDFQKEILPGMISLSRHEICEDMHSIGYELRKNGSRRANGLKWFRPVRRRRSRR